MSRRRYISTDISLDTKVNKLAVECGDFAALLYTWLIPHAGDDGVVTGDPEELLLKVAPGRRDKSAADIEEALAAMDRLGLISWSPEDTGVQLRTASFYKYQTYIQQKNRRTTEETVPYNNNGGNQRETPEMISEQRETAQKGASPSPTVSPSPSPSLSLPPSLSPREDVGLVARALGIDRPTDRQTKRLTNGINDQKYRHLNGEMVADAYAEWQDSLPPDKQHKDRVGGFLNQLEMRREQPAYFREAAPSSNGATSNGKHELASDGREYGTGRNPSYVRPETPIPSTIPEVRSLFQALKSFGTTSMREWDDLLTLNPHVRDGTIIFPTPDEGARATAQRYVHDIDMACRERNLRFEIRGDA